MQNLKVVCPECQHLNIIEASLQGTDIPCSNCKADLNDPFVLEVNDESCATHIKENDIAVLVDFYSTTCGPCMAMYEDYEDTALSFSMKVRFLKINADNYQEVAKEYGVRALPTIIAFKGGKEVNRRSGQQSQVALSMWAESLL